MSDRSNSAWLCTASGRAFYPLDPRPEDIDIEDIAHALAHLCRFAGHCEPFYSVGEHSVRVADLARVRRYPVPVQFAALMHDAAEAYIVDLPRPLKRMLPAYQDIEARIEFVINAKYGIALTSHDHERIKDMDNQLLATERRDLMSAKSMEWSLGTNPLSDTIEPWTSGTARRVFLDTFRRLSNA